ncbi:inositol monophosphatase family protein [Belliella marina]|uniref:Inositol-1-monophosphatase n=1 Tax=Belliella marina TaxID=1644146 RepID=A0ABW4VMS6_9BACT
MIDLNQVLDQTKEVAKRAGAFIRKERQHFDLNKVEEKGLNDLVSYVDKEAEKIIVENLSQILPEAGFITEEGTTAEENKEYTWIIDPLDGTTNFIHGIPIFCVSIGLQKGEEMVLGVVYEVNLHECFYALKGQGAFCNDTRIHVSKANLLSQSLLATGFPYSAFGKIDEYLAIMRNMMQKTHGLRRLGSAAADLCYVACGRMDGYFEYNLNSYDVAAGSLIVQEAGGTVTDFKNGNDFVFGREIIATNTSIHGELSSELQEIWNK